MSTEKEVLHFAFDFDTSPAEKKLKKLQANVVKIKQGFLTELLTGQTAKFNKKTGEIQLIDVKGFKKHTREALDWARDSFRAFFQKDLKGLVEQGGKMFEKLRDAEFLNSLRMGGGKFKAKGAGLKKEGAALREKGAKTGGIRGAGQTAKGFGLQALGGASKAIGQMAITFAKMGPMISLLGSLMTKVVLMFIDAEASAKGFQKDILATTSTAEFLANAGGDANVAYEELKATLGSVRDAAFDLENLKWGISAEDHKAALTALNAEGVSLHQLSMEAADAGKSMKSFISDLTHTSVAYSRAFGVPLQEINQMQGEMMSNMALSAKEVQLGFASMTRGAADSGIAANKFYSIIRGLSSDLSTYNSRLEDSVKILRLLGKVMNPRDAAKFMQTAAQGLKNMGRAERLRLTLLTGEGKMGKLIERDTNKKKEALAQSVSEATGRTMEDVQRAMVNPATFESVIKTADKSKQGGFRDQFTDIQLQQSRAKKGTFGISSAAAGLGPAAALEAMQGALAQWGGGKKLADGAGSIGMEMMAENLGVSQEQLDQMIKFEKAVDNQREVMKDTLKNGGQEAEDLKAQLAKAGITATTDAELQKKLDEAGYDQITDSMDDGTKKALEEQVKVKSFAEQQTNLTQTVVDKLTVLVDFVQNQLYNGLIDIYDGVITSIPNVLIGEAKKRTILESIEGKRMASRTGMKELGTITDKDSAAKSGVTAAMNNVMSALQSKVSRRGQLDAELKRDAAAGPLGKILTPEQEAAKQAEIESLSGQIRTLQGSTAGMVNTFTPEQLGAAMTLAFKEKGGVLDPQRVEDMSLLGKQEGTTTLQAAQRAGFSSDEIMSALQKTPWLDEGADFKGGHKERLMNMQTMAGNLQSIGYYDKEKGAAVDPKIAEKAAEAQVAGADAATKTHDVITTPQTAYFKFSDAFTKGIYKTTVKEATLEAMRTALFEYYLYSEEEDRGKVAAYMRDNGMTSSTIGKASAEYALGNGTGALDMFTAPANARGGLVTSVANGLASVRAASGEGLASIGPGERILPAGSSGGGGINIHVNGIGGSDLARVLHAKVVDGIAEYKRRERYT